MIIGLLTLLIVFPTLLSVPFYPYIIAFLTITYYALCLKRGRKLRLSRKLAVEKGRDGEEAKMKIELESDYVDRAVGIFCQIFLSFLVSGFILHFSDALSPLLLKVIFLSSILCLYTIIYMEWSSEFHERKRYYAKKFKGFSDSYLREKFQEQENWEGLKRDRRNRERRTDYD